MAATIALAITGPTPGIRINLVIPTANHKPRRGAELVGVAKRPASAIGGHHDD